MNNSSFESPAGPTGSRFSSALTRCALSSPNVMRIRMSQATSSPATETVQGPLSSYLEGGMCMLRPSRLPTHFVETRPTEDLTAIVDPREWKVEELPVISTRVQNDVLALAEHVPVPARSSLYRERHPAEHTATNEKAVQIDGPPSENCRRSGNPRNLRLYRG